MLFKKIISILLLLVVFPTSLRLCQAGQNTTHVHFQLQKMTEDDKELLSLFFEALIRLDTFGYTIFGCKPISYASYSSNLRGNFFFPMGATYHQGEELWNRYSPSFYIKNFVFKFEHIGDMYGILLINKNNFLKVVNDHIAEFRKILGEDITSESLFLQIIDNRNSIWKILKEDHCLLGTLLGYGYKNSQMFKRREEIRDLVADLPPPLAFPEQIDIFREYNTKFYKNKYREINNINDLIFEYNDIQKTLKCAFTDYNGPLNLFPDVGFAVDPDTTETKILLEQYKRTEIDIMKAFMSDNFLEAVLCKMSED